MLLIYPRPVILLAAVKDFFPIEGTRKTFREVAALYRAFGHGDRIAMAEGVHGHMYSPENRRAAFAFIDRFSGMPARTTLDPIKVLDAPALRVTPTGQVRVDLTGGRSLPEVIREEFRARPEPPAKRTLADVYRDGADPVAQGPIAARGAAPAAGVIAWESAGTSTVGDVRVDRYRLYHGDHLVIPLLHIHRETPARGRAVVALALEGKVGAADWPAVRRRLDAGEEVLSFDLRGVGENRMRYRAASGDDPTLAEADEARAYFNPLSGVLANHVYNSLLTGRPVLPGGDRRRRDRVAVRAGEARSGAPGPGPVRLRARAGRLPPLGSCPASRSKPPRTPRPSAGRRSWSRCARPGRSSTSCPEGPRSIAEPGQDDSARWAATPQTPTVAPIARRSSAGLLRADRIHCAAADASPPAAMARPAWPK